MQHYAAAQFEVYVDAGWGSIRDALSIRQCANRSSFDASGFDEAGGGVIRCCAIPHTQTTTPGAKGRFAYVPFMTVGFDRLTASYLLLHALAPERFFLCAASWLCWCVHGFPFLIGVRGLCRADLRIYRTPRCYRLQLCGQEHDATRQLVEGVWHYRRSGVLGAERTAQGAIPVARTLQQLGTTLSGGLHDGLYSPSLDLTKKGQARNECEVDFVWVIPRPYPRKTVIILGECKDQGPIKLDEFERDVENLRRVADAFPRKRFKTFILLAKLNPFTPAEIERAKTLNTEYQQRTILLTARELEPYHIYERTKAEFDIDSYGGTPENLARNTAKMYFSSSESNAAPDSIAARGAEH